MEDKEFLEVIDKGFASVGSKLEAQIAELNETAKKILVKPEDVLSPEEVKKEEEARLEQADAVSSVTEMKFWDIPVGQAVVGGFSAVFASELVDGFLIKQGDWAKGIVKLIGAGVAAKWGGRLLGSTGSKAMALLLAYDGIRSLIPIDTWAKKGADAVTGMIPGGGLGGFKENVGGEPRGNGHKEDYYAAMKGGRR